MNPRAARPAWRWLALCPLLGGCASKYVFEDFRGRYQSAELPTAFATGKTGLVASGSVSWNDQERMEFARQDTAWGDSAGYNVQFDRERANPASPAFLVAGRYRIERSPILVSGSLAFHLPIGIAGVTGGVSAPEWEHFQAGVFAGYTQMLLGGRLAPMVAMGLFLNRVSAAGRYWNDEVSLIGEIGTDPPSFRRDTTRSHPLVWSVPMKIGLLYRPFRAFQPYAYIYATETQLWPAESDEPGRYRVDDGGFALGIRNGSVPGLLISLEWIGMSVGGPMHYEADASKLALLVQRELGR